MSKWEQREQQIAKARLQAALTLKSYLQRATHAFIESELLDKPDYQPGIDQDDLIELCSIVASIRYDQVPYE